LVLLAQIAEPRHCLAAATPECTSKDEYIATGDPDGPLFRTAAGKTGELTRNPMWHQYAYRDDPAPRRRGRHTAYLKNKGLLEHAQVLANRSPMAR
jgi:hypothetical protein